MRAVLRDGLWRKRNHEAGYHVNITRKILVALARHHACSLVETYAAWEVVSLGAADFLRASEIEERYLLSFWDAMIVAAALKACAASLWTEELAHGQIIEGIQVVNPLFPGTEETGEA